MFNSITYIHTENIHNFLILHMPIRFNHKIFLLNKISLILLSIRIPMIHKYIHKTEIQRLIKRILKVGMFGIHSYIIRDVAACTLDFIERQQCLC